MPLLAPPPIEKLKKWQASKEPTPLGVVKESEMEDDDAGDSRRLQVEAIVCGAFPDAGSWEVPVESPGRIKLACGNFSEDGALSDAFAMAGLNVAPQKVTQGGASPSPVDAARSIALENAMRRANRGTSKFDFGSNARSQGNTKSLLENDMEASISVGSMEDDQPSKGPSIRWWKRQKQRKVQVDAKRRAEAFSW